MAEITQIISTVTNLPTPPNPNNPATFDDLAYPYTVAQNAFSVDVNDMATELNTFATQTNAVKDEVNTAKNTAVSSANTAITKASEASASATSAYNAQLAAEVALDKFNDRYLGAKTTPPTLDNDGNPLQSGAMYFNTTSNSMYVRDTTLNQWISLSFVPTDHGGLTGLTDDDHTQYHNDARGDARYYTQSANDILLSAKVNTSDLTELTQDTIGSSIVAGNDITVSYNDTTGLTEVAFSGSIAGGFTNMQVFNTSGTFNIASAKGAGVYFIEVVGGGGAGGSCNAATLLKTSSGAGGGGVRGFVNITSNVTVTIGAGGVPVSGSSGGNGGTTTFGSYATANGGSGGYTNGNFEVPAGGTASAVGMINYKAYSGQDGGLPFSATTVNMVTGGGSSPFIVANTNVQITPTSTYIYGIDGRASSGCGGSGCTTVNAAGPLANLGGSGGSGYVIVYW